MFFQKIIVQYEINLINNHKIIILNRQGRLKHRFISEIWIMNRFYDQFDNLSDNYDFLMIFWTDVIA